MESYNITVTLFPEGSGDDPHQKAWGYQAQVAIDLDAVQLLPREQALELTSVPVVRLGPVLVVAMSDPDDSEAYVRLSELTGLRLRPVAAAADEIRQVIPKVYAVAMESSPQAQLQPATRAAAEGV